MSKKLLIFSKNQNMIKHLRIGESISSFGKELNLQGKEMLIKDNSTYIEGKGWVSVHTREKILSGYSTKPISNPVLLPMLSNLDTEITYKQKLMDKAALKFLAIHAKSQADIGGADDSELINWAYESAQLFIQEREKYILED